jgi:uncharacterized membrane-anchored protein
MKQTFITFRYSLLNYAIITLPVIAVPIMYGYSLLLAVGFGIIAWLVYTIIFLLIKSSRFNPDLKWLILILAVPIGVAVAYSLIEVFGVWKSIWKAGWLMLFPLAAVIAGWIGICKTRTQIDEHLNPSSQEYLIY